MITFITIIFLHLGGSNQNEIVTIQKGNTIHVSIDNVSSNRGQVSFALFQKDNFLKKPISRIYVDIKDHTSEVVFKNIAVGTYAIVCYHDENNNKRMDFVENGMPLEDYGVSNNVFNFGPPDFESSKFEHGEEAMNLEIRF
ncbi:MAG: hypothetical protein COB98_08615 [Flavobacteriaceae bacterium]|nr:MAG: hypothetical protein COB98_08615 [Flavobacteriaceae bacterium]